MGTSERRTAQHIADELRMLPVPEREAALVRLCGDDAALRGEVSALLAAGNGESLVVDVATVDSDPANTLGTATALPSLEQPGSHIGPYKLLRQLGEGGFGSVFMAEQERPVRRVVALKIIKLGMDTRQVVARFEQERQALAILDHPNIAKVFDAGATETGRPYFVMELCVGKPIDQYCDKNRLSIEQRLELFIEICLAVQHAHTKGLIHRDIKPGNVLVSLQDDRPHVKVIDFGIAKATASKLTERTLFTELRQFVGTPQYMSPEQAEGSLDIDTRTDVYALGVMLYELLTGTTPFSREELRSVAYAEIQRIIREVDPPKPSARLTHNSDTIASVADCRRTEPRQLRLTVHGELDWIVMKCLEKDRSRRYETANSLAMDVRRYLTREAVLAAPPSTIYRLRKFVQRYRFGVAAGGAVAAALLIGLAAFAWQAKVARRAADTAERAAYQAQMVSAAHAIEDQRIAAASALLGATSPRLRGWEYQHLMSRLDRSLPSPVPSDWRVSGIVGAANASTIAVRRSINGGPVEWAVLDADRRTERIVVPGCERWGFELSPDGTRAAWVPSQADDQRPAVLWSVETRKVLATVPSVQLADKTATRAVSWSPDGDRLLVCGGAGFAVYDGNSGALIGRSEQQGWAHFCADDRFIFVNGAWWTDFDSRSYRLLDARSFEPRTDVMRFEASISGGGVAFWRSRIACSLEDGTLRLLDCADGQLKERLKIPAGIGVLQTPAWSRDGRSVAIGSMFGRVGVWDAETGAPRRDFAGPQAASSGLLFLQDSGDLWACDAGGNHFVWPVSAPLASVLTAHKSFVYPVVISKDGSLLLTGGWDGSVRHAGGLKLWDARTGAAIAEYGKPGEIYHAADLSPDGRYAVAGIMSESESQRRTDVIDLFTGAVVSSFKPATVRGQPTCAIVHPDSRRVISTYPYGEAFVWELATGKVLWQTDLQHGPSTSNQTASSAAAVSRDGRLLAFADKQTGIRLVNADTYRDVRRWEAHADSIWSLSFSGDGEWLLSASDDDTAGVWDVATGTLVARLVGHGTDVLCARMSPDGTRIASGGRDGYVRLWDTTSFQNVAQLGGHKDYIYSLAWGPDGRQLISGSGDSTVRIWDTRTLADQLAAGKARTEALPGLEAAVARGRADASDPATAIDSMLRSAGRSQRDRELVAQVAARFAARGMPAYYRAPRASAAVVIDGRTDEPAWEPAAWSAPFVDIEGDAKPKPRFKTQVRMLWGDEYLYIAAKLEEPHVWGTKTTRDEIVFQDNDFEVFVDPAGHGRWYGEVEVNALGTIFDLRLDRPYSERGIAHHEWSPPGLKAAVAIDGTLNDPSDVDRGWTVEIAIPHAALADHAEVPVPPRAGVVWRINFSRVQWQHDVKGGRYAKRANTPEDNWVWTPQHVVNMHVPREWGFVEFIGKRP